MTAPTQPMPTTTHRFAVLRASAVATLGVALFAGVAVVPPAAPDWLAAAATAALGAPSAAVQTEDTAVDAATAAAHPDWTQMPLLRLEPVEVVATREQVRTARAGRATLQP